MSLLPLPSPEELDPAVAARLVTLPRLNVLSMLGRTGWLDTITAALAQMFDDAQFPARDREVMILRIAAHACVEYPIPQHRVFARNVGLSDAEVEAILRRDLAALDGWTATLCRICEEITDRVVLSEASLAELVARYGRNDATKAVWLMGWFNMLVRFVGSTRVPVEAEFDGALSGPA
jgi:hypothetical protein